MNTLRLRARGAVLCAHYQAHANGTRRFVGRRMDRTLGHDEVNPETGQTVKTGGWPSTGEAEDVPYCAEYVFAVRDGDVWAADEATAKICGVPFDPTFGGEAAEMKDVAPVASSVPAATSPPAHDDIVDHAEHDPKTTA